MSDKKQKSALINSGTGILITVTLLVLCVIFGIRSFSWFSSGSSVSATGMGVSVGEIPKLIIRRVSEGTDIGDYTVHDEVENRLDIEYDGFGPLSEVKISPGVTGSFKIYLENEGSGNIKIYPNILLKTGREESVNPAAESAADRYANHHIVFTYHAKNTLGAESVVDTDGGITLVPNTEVECQVSWEWVAEYNDARISGVITSDNYSDYLFGINDATEFNAASASVRSEAYNNADIFIAVYMNPLYYHIGFSMENT